MVTFMKKMQPEPFVIERVLNATADVVWKAITEKDRMKQWYFDLAAFKPEPGFEFRFSAENEGRTFVHLCKVAEVIPGKKLSYSWRYEGTPGQSMVTLELFPEGNKTRLRLTHAGLETFPQDKDFKRENFTKGWTHIIGKSLMEYLN
jgi:uncharacterized protein YndB with AHSA1/START domain